MNQTVHSFEASLIQPDFRNEPVGGRVLVGRTQLQFQSETISVEIPLEALEIEFEEGGKGIFLSDANRPDVKIFTLNHAILRYPTIKAQPQIAAVLGKREVSKALRMTAYFLGGCAVAAWLGSLALSAMAQAVAARVPVSWEEKFGAREMAALQSSGELVNDSNDVAQLTALAQPLVQVLPAERRNLKFYITENPEPNAFALPGGHVIVNRGLLEMIGKPEEILGVLAHELAHETKRHAIRRQISAAGPMVIFGVFLHSGSGLGNGLAMGSGLMVFQGFSREYETEADDTGWDYLVAANINPRGMIDAFHKFESMEDKMGFHGAVPEAFLDHPSTEKRIARLEKKWNKLERKTGFLELPPVSWTLDKTDAPGPGKQKL